MPHVTADVETYLACAVNPTRQGNGADKVISTGSWVKWLDLIPEELETLESNRWITQSVAASPRSRYSAPGGDKGRLMSEQQVAVGISEYHYLC